MNIEQPQKIGEGLAAITLRPGDKLIIRCPGPMKQEWLRSLSECVKAQFPDVPVMILEGGLEALVLRTEDHRDGCSASRDGAMTVNEIRQAEQPPQSDANAALA